MENKSNSLNRIKRHQREKVLRFSIRKYSFGAASVAVAALMFLGAHAVSADVVDAKNQPAIGAANPNEEKSPLIESAPKSKNEETKETEKVEVAKETKEREKTSENKEAVEANPLNNGTSTSTITVTKDASGDKVTEKQTLDKSQLQASITKVQELLDKVNKEKAPASTLAAIQADLEKANSVLNNNSLELTQAEIDAVAKKLNEKIFVLSSMPKAITPEKVVKEGKNTIANTGSHDSRNGQRMGEGVSFRANDVRVEGALYNVKEYISEPSGHGSTAVGQRTRTIDKTFMTARYSKENGMKFITYDVYFQNDGKALDGYYRNAFWFYPPRDLLPDVGRNYPIGVVSEAYYERYRKKAGATGILSDNPDNFTREGERYTVPLGRLASNSYQDSDSQRLWGAAGGLFQMSGGPNSNDQRQQMLKQLQYNEDLNRIIKLKNDPNGSYPGGSYSHLLTVGIQQDFAYKYHVKMRLRDDVTDAQAQRAGAMAVTAKEGFAKTALAAYVYAATGTKLESKPDAQLNPIQGLTVTKTVGDTLGNPDDPANSGYVTHKESKPFPAGMTWSWEKGVKPASTATTAGVFKYKVIARYQDGTSSENPGSGSDGTVTLNVKPKTPVIDQNSVNEKAGKKGQNVVVDVKEGVPDGSTVTLYSGDEVIGTGITRGQKATINVSRALPSTAIKAKTTVKNTTVDSEFSAPVIPTPERDTQPPTVKIVYKTSNNAETTLTDDISKAPTIDVYRGANIELPLKYYDNNAAGKVNIQHVSGIPKGVWFNKNASEHSNVTIQESGKTENAQGSYTVRGRVDANAPLGISIVKLKVSDAADGNVNQGNHKEVKFRVRVLDLDFEQGVSAQTGVAKISREVELNRPVGDANNYLTVNDGSQRSDRLFPSGMTFRFIRGTEYKTNLTYTDPGKYTVKAAAFYPTTYVPTNGESVTATNATGDNVNEIRGRAYIARDIEFRVKPTAPTVTPQENGDVTVTPVNEKNVNSFNFTYNDPNNSSRKITATKTKDGWTLNNAPDDGVTIDKTTGKVTIKDRAIKDSAPITAKSETSDHVESNPATVNSKAGEKEPPKFAFDEKNTTVENGFRTVYVTPTESNNFRLGTVTDNSKKLIESRLSSKDNNTNDLDYGLSYEGKLLKTNNGPELTAPKDIMVTGTLDKTNKSDHGNKWTNGKEIVTRYYVATDAAGNELRNQDNVASNPTRVVFKVLTQAEKYVPKVGTQQLDKDVTGKGAKLSDAEFNAMKPKLDLNFTATRGEVKINGKTKDLELTMKDRGEIKKKPDGTYYIGATIKYPDLSTEDIEIPISKSDTSAPTATMDGLTLTNDINTTAKFVVFKGATFNPTIRVSDDKSNVTNLSVSGISNGTKIEKSGNWSKDGTDVKVELGNATATNTATLGDHEGSVVVKDALNNTNTYKFKYTVVDVEVKETPKTVPLNTQLGDSHYNVKVVDTPNADGNDKYYPTGMSFKWKKGNSEVANETELAKPGVITDYKALVKFPNGGGVRKSIDGKEVRIYAPATVERPVTFHVKPVAPTISQWQNGNVKVTPPTDGDKVTIPLTDGTVTLVKKDSGWELETPKAGLVFHNGSLEIPKKLVGTSVTAKATKGTGGSAVDSDNTTYTPKSHTVTKVDIVKEAGSPLSRDDLSGKTGVTGVVDGTETKDFATAKIRSVVEKSELPKVTPDSKQTVPVTITYEDGSTETTDVIVKVKPQAPTVTPKENGTVEITPILTGEGTTTITYTGEDNTPQTVTVTKAGDGTWTSSNPTIAVDANGKVTIPADKVKDGSPITAQVTSKLTGLPSQPAKATVGKPLEVAFGKPENAREKAKYTSKVVVTPNKSNSTITAPTVNGLTVNSEGKITGTPDIKDWDRIEEHRDVTIKVTVTHEGDTPVTKDVIVNVLRDTDGDGDPDITDKDDDNDGIPDEEEKKNGTDPKAPTTQTPTIGITRKENGDAIVTPTKPGGGTYPSGTKVVIPGDNNTTIEVEIGNDGSGTVPNDKLPKGEVSGKGIIKEPNKEPSKPVNVTTPARKPSTVDLEQDSKTGDVTVTPKKPDGTKYPSGTKVEIPGKDKDHPITITIGKDGTGKVPNSELPEGKVPGTSKITENGKTPEEVKVETPKRIDPILPETEAPTDIAITRKKNGDAIVTPKKPGGGIYPQGTKVEIPGEDGKTIEVTIGKDGSGEVPNDKLPKEAKPGRGTVTEPNKKPSRPVSVTTPARKTPTVELQQDPDTGEVTVTPKKPDGTLYPENTKVEISGKDKEHPITITIGKDGKGKVPNNELPEGKVPGTSKITVPGKPAVEVPNVTTPSKLIPTVALDQDPDTGEVTVTPKKPDGTLYPENTKVEIPGKDKDHPITITIGKDGTGKVPNSELPEGKVPGTGKITVPGKPAVEVPNVTTPSKVTPTVELQQDPDTGEVTVTPKKPDGTLYPENTKVEIPGKDKDHPITITIGKDGTGKVPNSELPEGKVPGTSKITVPGKPAVEVPNVTTPSKVTPTVELDQDPDTGEVTVTPKKPDGTLYPENTKVEIPGKDKDHPITITIGKDGTGKVPNSELPEGKVPGTSKITVPGKPAVEVPNVTTPSKLIPTVVLDQDPDTGEVTVTPKKPDGTLYPENTKVEIPGKDKDHPITITIGKDGTGKVPNSELPEGKVPGTSKITENGKTPEEVKVETPKRIDPILPETEAPTDIAITRKKNGDAIVTPKKPGGGIYPQGTKVEIPGEDGKTIEVTIGKDGSGEVPNDKLPKEAKPGRGTVTEPNKKPSRPVSVTTPARKTPTVELQQDPDTGEVTVTPKKPDGTLYPENTKVEISGKDKEHPITITIGKDGKGKVPNNELPEGKVPGTSKITVPGKPAVEVPNVTTPSKLIPTVALDQDPDTGEVTVTPKKPDGTLYPENTKVEIPGKDKDHPITITIGKDGTGKVPNSELPEGKVPGTGKITVPGKPAVEVPNVTTPSKVTPTVELQQDPDTGEVTVTPKKPDGTLYPENTKVEIPGKDKDHPITITIGKDGTGKVPNSELPEGKVPGTSKITVPGKPAVEVPNVTTPSKVTPTVELDQDPDTGEVTVTPKKPDGTLYPENTKVEIPGKDKDHPITITIGKDGTGKVPNSELPEGKVPGTSKITVPGKPAVEVPNVTTPSKLIPTVVLDQDPDTGEVTVTPKKPDGTLYPENTKVEIPGKDKDHPITITIGKDGTGKVPNSELPEGKVPGTSKITVPGKPAVEVPNVTTPSKVTPTVELDQDPDTGEVTVTPKKPDGTLYPENTKVEIPGKDKDHPITITIGKDGTGKVPNSELPEGKVPGTSKITVPGKPAVEVPNVETPGKIIPGAPTTEQPVDIGITRKPNGDAVVTPKKQDKKPYPSGTKVEIPGEDKDGNPITITVTIGDNGSGEVPNDNLPKKAVPGTGTVTEPNKNPSQPVKVTTPARKTPTLDVDQDPDTGEVTVTPKKPDGTLYPENTKVEIPGKDKDHPITITIGKDGTGKVPNSELPEGKVPGTSKITVPGKPAVEVPNVTTPSKVTPTVELDQDPDTGEVTVTPKKPDGTLYPENTKVEIPGKDKDHPITITIGKDGTGKVPNSELPEGKVPGTSKITVPGKPAVEVPNVTTPSKLIPTVVLDQDPDTGEVTVTPKKPDGTLYPENTKVEIPGKDKDHPITITIGKDGTGKVPNSELPEGKVPGTAKITEPGKPAVEVPVVTTPAKLIPTVELQQDPDTGEVTVTPKKPDGTLYPENTKVEIPGKDKDHPITITIGKDGTGKVPNSELPEGKVPGTSKITVPGKPAVEVPNVTTPSKVTPTVELDQDPDTGEVTVTPKKPDGTLYPENTKVEIPGKDKDHPITVTLGKDGKGKVPNNDLPDGEITGTGKITPPGKPSVELEVKTPKKLDPNASQTEQPGGIEITRKPNGDAVVTPKKPDGTTYPSGTKVVIPGDHNTPIEVIIGEDGSGTVPNDSLPKGDIKGKGTVTEPDKRPSNPVDVTTPAKLIPTVELNQDPSTGDVTVTPKKPDGTLYPENTKVEIPGKDKDHPITITIGKDGTGKVPNDKLPKKAVPGTGTVTEPNKKPSQPVNVTTPAHKTPTLDVERDPNTGDVTVTPKRPDGSTYPPGTMVEIPGKDKDHPITVAIGEDGTGKVPNSDLPDVETPGTGKITEPGKPAVEVPVVTTPAKLKTSENGELPDPITLPELTIEVRWIDEDGNVLKPSVKTGEADATAHGSIPGYEFVRTIIDENEPVITHIFRKVSGSTNPNTIPVTPVTPDTNRGSGQDAPAPTTPVPDAVTPNADQVDTKTTVDNGAKSNGSQNVLPNTGTESNATLASLGLLGMLGGLGLALAKKKED